MNKNQRDSAGKILIYCKGMSINDSAVLACVLTDYFTRMSVALANFGITNANKSQEKYLKAQRSSAEDLLFCQKTILGNAILEHTLGSGTPIFFKDFDAVKGHVYASAEEGIKFRDVIHACNIINSFSRQKPNTIEVDPRYEVAIKVTNGATVSLKDALARTRLSPTTLANILCGTLNLCRPSDKESVARMVTLASLEASA